MGAHASRVPCSASRRTPSSHHFSPTKWLTGFVPARPCHRPASPCVNSCSLGSIRGSTALLWLQPVPRRCPIGLQARKVIAQAEASPTSAGLGIHGMLGRLVKHPLYLPMAAARLENRIARGSGAKPAAKTCRSGTYQSDNGPAGIGI